MKSIYSTSIIGILPVALAVSVLAGGCKKADEAVNQAGGNTERNYKTVELRATWNTACEAAEVLPGLFSGLPAQKTEVEFGSSLTRTTTFYSDANCQKPAVQVTENGHYMLGSQVADNTNLIDIHYDSVAVTAMNSGSVKLLDSVKACGVDDWRAGESRDVTTKTAAPVVVSRCWKKTPRDVYDIAYITNDKLEFGSDKDGKDKKTPANRPTVVDQARVFSK